MSLDRSLKSSGGNLASHRSVLTRAERIAKMKDLPAGFDTNKRPILGLPKTNCRKAAV